MSRAPTRGEAIALAQGAVLQAALNWRNRVSIASPPGLPPPEASTRLAEAVDHLVKIYAEDE